MKKLQGLSLIEVLISLFILSFGLLALDVMQMASLKQAVNSYYFTIAENQLNFLAEQLRAGCPSFDEWNKKNGLSLPEGRGEFSGESRSFKIKICWEKIHCLSEDIFL